jgi:hypothetical protein
MKPASTDVLSDTTSQPPPFEDSFVHRNGSLPSEELKEDLRALAIRFDLDVIQCPVAPNTATTERTGECSRTPTPALVAIGSTTCLLLQAGVINTAYSQHASAAGKRGSAAKILVTCEGRQLKTAPPSTTREAPEHRNRLPGSRTR